MKLAFIIYAVFLVCYNGNAQDKPPVSSKPGRKIQFKEKPQLYSRQEPSTLNREELKTFDYDLYIRQRDSARMAQAVTAFKARLISIDSLISINRSYKLEDPMLGFTITYWESGSIDTFAISLTDDGFFSEPENFDNYIQELQLLHIQYALTHADHVNRQIGRRSSIQLDVRRDLNNMQVQAGYNNSVYANKLLTFIRDLLATNKAQLHIHSKNDYLTDYEKEMMTLDQTITFRETFIKYVYAKLGY